MAGRSAGTSRDKDQEKDLSLRFKKGGPRATLARWDGLNVEKETEEI